MKTIIVTGCSRGIGLAIVLLLVKSQEFNVLGTSRSGSCPISDKNFTCYQLDISKSSSIASFIEKIENKEINYLINNAGILIEKWDNSAISIIQLKETFNVNLFGTVELAEAIIPRMVSKGHIVNVSSGWGAFSEPNLDEYQPHYKMSKAALNMYTKTMSKRLISKNITVSSIDPGWTKTDMGGSNADREPEEAANDILELIQSNVETGKFWHFGKVRGW
ncbi:SDR family NAD(P)-dependent oxidoreductase [Maribacter sp. SA7]|uniref:SDR family NAD(P)-dependent oxidoreductase n=1 Tax=Maribacter zhoushanensis TaxID=3030012 RepID=UPI0023EB2A1B|nr:SDR family NAD(P)-dependent oxidoreductase [Maribacter zhoushanensis]MDF4203828.1 SDR family NAD(P)-dependent oxidoreductase [Maribacter zhoushanensis]